MSNFDIAFAKTLKFEGGYGNHPLDRGGKTKYGITWRTMKRYNGRTDVKNLDIETAKKIYKAFYWELLKCGAFQDYISYELFDAGVNHGIRKAAKFLQHALNWLNRNEDVRLYKDLKVDGLIGSKTINAYNKLGIHDKVFLYTSMRGERYKHYSLIVMFNPKQEIFFRSWLRRIL